MLLLLVEYLRWRCVLFILTRWNIQLIEFTAKNQLTKRAWHEQKETKLQIDRQFKFIVKQNNWRFLKSELADIAMEWSHRQVKLNNESVH